jgi:hypothetical protein
LRDLLHQHAIAAFKHGHFAQMGEHIADLSVAEQQGKRLSLFLCGHPRT